MRRAAISASPRSYLGAGLFSPSRFVYKSRDRRGKKLPFSNRVRSKVLCLYFSLRKTVRERRIPEWFSTELGLPKYLFRIKGRDLSARQSCISTIARVYHVYATSVMEVRTSGVVKLLQDDGISRLFRRVNCRNWMIVVSMITKRLKVLLLAP